MLTPNYPNLFGEAAAIRARLKRRLSLGELFGLAFCLCMAGFFVWVHHRLAITPFDFGVYIDSASGTLTHFYYADWILPVMWLLARLPDIWNFLIWDATLVLSIFFAARVFGGRAGLALVTFQMLYVLFLGQIVPLLIGGLALQWWGMANKRWWAAGLGLALAGAKFQLGLTFGLLLWLFGEGSWRERLRVFLVPVGVAAVSLIINPDWPLDLLRRMGEVPPNDWGSISLWRWLGPWSLLLWLPPLILPLTKPQRFFALAATACLAIPYFQQTDLLALFVLPVGPAIVLLGNLGFFFFGFQFAALQLLGVIPLLLYASIILPGAVKWLGGNAIIRKPSDDDRTQ